ncbi:MAG: sialidase family protein, partial [Ignavibacteria bacterium]
MVFKLFGLSVVISILILSISPVQDDDRRRAFQVKDITGDELPVRNSSNIIINSDLANKEPVLMYSDSIIQITDVYTGESTLYDLQSNGVPQHCWQDPLSRDNIHAVLTWNQTPGIPAVNRRTKYIKSDDRGVTWISLGEIPSGASAGFPAIYGMNDGRIIIANHSVPTGTFVRTHIFVEVAAGTGTFTTCDPGTDPVFQKLWPRLVTTNNNQVVFGASGGASGDTIFYTNRLITTCTFSGWIGHSEVNNAGQYIFDRGSDGRIGLAFLRNDFNPANQGDVMFKESTDNGLTWTQPVLVYDAILGPEFFGALRGIDLVYQGN